MLYNKLNIPKRQFIYFVSFIIFNAQQNSQGSRRFRIKFFTSLNQSLSLDVASSIRRKKMMLTYHLEIRSSFSFRQRLQTNKR